MLQNKSGNRSLCRSLKSASLIFAFVTISSFAICHAENTVIKDKSLVAWVTPANLTQRGGSVLTIEKSGGIFDAIVFGELAPEKWMAGSNGFARTNKEQQEALKETAGQDSLVQIAIVYKGKHITIYHNGSRYSNYTAESQERFAQDSIVLLGLRHLGANPENRFFAGSIEDARIYDIALTEKQIASLKFNQPSIPKPVAWWDFEEGRAGDRMNTLPVTTLSGNARIEGGRLHLDGQGSYLMASQAMPNTGLTNVDINQLDNATRMQREKLLSDPHRPGYHFAIPEGRCMPFDPNGAIYWKGRYHLFYIFQDERGHNWGHVSSTDLFHWRHHPTRLVSGMFSGNCFINKQGRPTMCYHQVGQGNAMAVALDDNLNDWKKLPSNPITPKTSPGDPFHGKYRSWDPFGWIENDTYYAIFGGKHPAIVKSDRIEGEWKYVGDLMGSSIEGVSINEDVSCADLFKLGNKHMLLCISHRLGCRYYLGDWKNEQFFPTFHEKMSWIDNSYFAPESLLDDKGRRIMWAWLFDEPGFNTRMDYGWSGTMSLPRVLSLSEQGTLNMNPPVEIEKLRYNAKQQTNLKITADTQQSLETIQGNSIELIVEADVSQAKQFGVKICCSPDDAEQTLVYYDAVDKKLKIDTHQTSLTEGPKSTEAGPFELKEGEQLSLRIFIDKSVVEVFANGRQAVMRRIYPSRSDSLGVKVFANGGPANITTVKSWDMMPSNPY